jgi:hydroxypyruvate reductase
VIKEALSDLTSNDLVLVFLSGGGSSLLSLPVEGISLNDLQLANQVLLSSGGNIIEINTIRKHISQIKGGQLVKMIAPARAVTLILSDVIGNPLDMIASGPTVPDPTTFSDAFNIVKKYRLDKLLPESIINRLKNGVEKIIPDTPKPDDPIFMNVDNILIGSNQDALIAAVQQAKNEGFNAEFLSFPIQGEASLAGEKMAEILIQMAVSDKPLPRPALLVAGGETSVTLPAALFTGKGGRNLETALSALKLLDRVKDAALITLASDGEDGLTDAAGGVVTGESYQRAVELRLDIEKELNNHNSYLVFEKLGDLLQPGPTQTNVNDICYLFTF